MAWIPNEKEKLNIHYLELKIEISFFHNKLCSTKSKK